MLLCYIDESGDEEQLRTNTDPPVLVLAGIVVDHHKMRSLTFDFLQLKKTFHPSAIGTPASQLSDVIRFEIKGSDLRRNIRVGGRNQRRAVLRFLDAFLELLEAANAKIVGKIHVKGSQPLGEWVYPHCVAAISTQFEAQLRAADNSRGAIILDSRTKSKNVLSVHRITTARFRSGGDPYQHLVESPVFGHSDAHVLLQVADLVASALLFPLACIAYSNCLINNVHLNDRYSELRERYGTKLRLLEHRYTAVGGVQSGGIQVVDHLNSQPSLALYTDAGYKGLD